MIISRPTVSRQRRVNSCNETEPLRPPPTLKVRPDSRFKAGVAALQGRKDRRDEADRELEVPCRRIPCTSTGVRSGDVQPRG